MLATLILLYALDTGQIPMGCYVLRGYLPYSRVSMW